MTKNISDVEIVRGLIEKELKTEDKVSRHYILHLIKETFTTPHLYNKALKGGQGRADSADQKDGVENIRIGANKLFRDCMNTTNGLALTKADYAKKNLTSKSYIVGDDGYIRRNPSFERKEVKQSKIMDFVPDDDKGITKTALRKIFCATITDERGLSQWDTKFGNDNKSLKKEGKPLKKKSDTPKSERIRKGKELCFSRLFGPLIKLAPLEEVKKGFFVKGTTNHLIAAKRAVDRLGAADLDLLKEWLRVS